MKIQGGPTTTASTYVQTKTTYDNTIVCKYPHMAHAFKNIHQVTASIATIALPLLSHSKFIVQVPRFEDSVS